MHNYGRRVYVKNSVTENVIGDYICPNCGQTSRLSMRQGYGFKALFSTCDSGHRWEISKQLYEKYKVGDTVRVYESTFGKDSVIIKDCYTEGIIIRSYPNIIDYQFDFKPTKIVFNGKMLPVSAWGYAEIHKGVDHHRRDVELIHRKEKTEYVQMSFDM